MIFNHMLVFKENGSKSMFVIKLPKSTFSNKTNSLKSDKKPKAKKFTTKKPKK